MSPISQIYVEPATLRYTILGNLQNVLKPITEFSQESVESEKLTTITILIIIIMTNLK